MPYNPLIGGRKRCPYNGAAAAPLVMLPLAPLASA